LGEIAAQRLGPRVALVTDAGLVKAGLVGPALHSLEEAGVAVDVFDAVVADPPEDVVLAAVARARDFEARAVIGFGGGSSIDVAKLVALLAAGGESLPEIYGVGLAKGPRLPLLAIPTTAGTGSEVTPISIVTTGAHEKKGVVSPLIIPDIALLDPDLTVNLPPHVTAATGIDAMVHAIEAFTSKNKKNPISDQLAKQALALLSANIRTACTDGKNLEARSGMLLGSMLAGMAFANAPVAAVHALAYPVGAIFHVPHGLSNALVLMGVMRFNLSHAEALYAELAPILDPAAADLPPPEAAKRFVESLDAICRDCKVPASLAEVGVARQDLERMATDAMKQTRLLVNNPREVTYDDAFKIYAEALGEARPAA
jgi:alcohol dehydrogenase class IV